MRRQRHPIDYFWVGVEQVLDVWEHWMHHERVERKKCAQCKRMRGEFS